MSSNSDLGRSACSVVFLDLHTSYLGAQRLLVDFLANMPAGLAASVVCSGEGRLVRELNALGVPFAIVPMPGPLAALTRHRPPGPTAVAAAARYLSGLRAAIRSMSPDVVVSNTVKAHALAPIAAPRGAAVGMRLQDFLPDTLYTRLLVRALWSSRVTGVACASEPVRLAAVARGFPEPRTRTVHSGAPVADAILANPQDGPPTAAVVAQLEPWKGQDIAIEAFARVLQAIPEARLRIIGRPVKTHLYPPYLIARSRALGIADSVVFESHLETLDDIYRGVDVLLHTTRHPEPFGTVLLEAMGLGIPVVAAASGGTPEMIEHGVSGLLVPPGDVTAAAAAVVSVLSDPALARRLRDEARRTVLEQFTLKRYAARFASWIEEIGSSRRPDWQQAVEAS